MKFKQYLRVVRLSFEMALRHSATDLFIIFGVVFQPLIVAVLGLYMLQGRGGDYAIFVVVGSGLTGLWTSLLFISGNSITQERWTGTLEMLVGVPTPLIVVVLGKNLAYVLQSFLSMVVAYILAAVLFGAQLQVSHPLFFAISILFTILAFVSFGLVIAPLFVMNPEVRRWQNGLEYPVYILSGFLFPILLLPGWTTPISKILAPYWAAQALHASTTGAPTLETMLGYWGIMLLYSLIYLAVSGTLFRRMLVRARREASLNMQ
ncbi:MAG: ABC transporter permease [Anaerolineales bacterium]